jgi:hypothetical protein
MAAEDRASSPHARTHLSDLARERKEALALSYEKLAAQCVDPETGEQTVKYSWLHRLATGMPVQAPDLPQLRGLAAGLKVSLGRVQEAAGAQFFGIETVWSASGEARALAERADQMTPEQRQQLLALIDTFAPPR